MTRPSPAPLREPRAGAGVSVLRDVLAIPGAYCLYDRDGVRIDETVTWTAGKRRGPAPDRIESPKDAAVVAGPVVFGGLLPKAHFGHVLLEMFTRMWAHDAGHADASIPIVHFTHSQRTLESFEQRLIDAAFDAPQPRRIPVDRPLHLREVIAPSQAIILGQPMDPAVLPLYDRVRQNIAGRVTADATPLYLSRSRIRQDLRRTLGETTLEERLQRRGIRVIHPQELPLEEQIAAVASASTVVGLAGSALHLTVLRDLDGARTISLDPRTPFAVQQDVDELREAQYHHVHAQLPLHPRLPGGRALEVGPYRNLLIPRSVERRILALL